MILLLSFVEKDVSRSKENLMARVLDPWITGSSIPAVTASVEPCPDSRSLCRSLLSINHLRIGEV